MRQKRQRCSFKAFWALMSIASLPASSLEAQPELRSLGKELNPKKKLVYPSIGTNPDQAPSEAQAMARAVFEDWWYPGVRAAGWSGGAGEYASCPCNLSFGTTDEPETVWNFYADRLPLLKPTKSNSQLVPWRSPVANNLTIGKTGPSGKKWTAMLFLAPQPRNSGSMVLQQNGLILFIMMTRLEPVPESKQKAPSKTHVKSLLLEGATSD